MKFNQNSQYFIYFTNYPSQKYEVEYEWCLLAHNEHCDDMGFTFGNYDGMGLIFGNCDIIVL